MKEAEKRREVSLFVTIRDDFSLEKIADCGQCFRARRFGDGTYLFISGDRVLRIRKVRPEEKYEVDCSGEEWNSFWKEYFDLDRDYSRIREICSSQFSEECDGTGTFLMKAAESGEGLRILRQNSWEVLITFILSQRKNMPAIAASVEKLSRLYGHRLDVRNDRKDDTDMSRVLVISGKEDKETGLYSFPTPEELKCASEQDLRDAGLGYRAPYVRDAIDKIMSGELDLEAMQNLDDDALFDRLVTVKGVGKKVADCISLFGFGRTGRSPVDVWIDRAISRCGGEDPFPKFGEYAGIMQQYVFYYMTHTDNS